ncbi:integral membrane protein [Lepidopterella palustris CBS 459.81]|uniref:Integral membrane protein n=1 Tax=Lepidopterella palustris CBS 459.81 TaxID=1314670 RepID=A0A8E2E577_9PEZI|nr:integral membrane protein [Lepidopterella palustris CBS 459.81]
MVEGALPPPPGVIPNFDHPKKTVWIANIVTQALCLSIVGVLMALRVHVRASVTRNWGKDDWLCIVGWILSVGYSATALTMGHFGGGINQWEVPKSQIESFGKTVYVTMVLYGPCAFFIKTSILIFLTRVFAPYQRAVMGIYIFIGFMLGYYLPVIVIKAMICRPVEVFWDADIKGQCFNQRALILADSCISVLSDLIIFALPLPLASDLHMPLKKKLRVAAVFSAGGLACVASVIRLVDIVHNGTSPNQTLIFMRVNLWGIAEVNIGLICACLPVLPAFYRYHFAKTLNRTGYTGYNSTDRSIEMMDSAHRKRNNVTMKNIPDFGSDENVLIGDKVQQGSLETSVHGNSEPQGHGNRRPSMDDQQMIMKTVEVHQTFT